MMVLLSGLTLSFSSIPLFAQELAFENFLGTGIATIKAVTSNTQAQRFVDATMGPFVQVTLKHQIRGQRHKQHPLPEWVTHKMVELAAVVATWQFAFELDMQLNQGQERTTSFLQ